MVELERSVEAVHIDKQKPYHPPDEDVRNPAETIQPFYAFSGSRPTFLAAVRNSIIGMYLPWIGLKFVSIVTIFGIADPGFQPYYPFIEDVVWLLAMAAGVVLFLWQWWRAA